MPEEMIVMPNGDFVRAGYIKMVQAMDGVEAGGPGYEREIPPSLVVTIGNNNTIVYTVDSYDVAVDFRDKIYLDLEGH